MNLEGKTAIVMGGGRDIGAAVSLKLGQLGANVVVNYHSSDAGAKNVVDAIKSSGGAAIAVQADATKKDEVATLVRTAIETFGPKLDILVNLVGGLVERRTMEEMDEDFFDYVIRLNVNSCFNAVKATLPHLAEGASIVNFSSQAARDGGGPGASAYATSKGAVLTFTRSLAKELGPRKIRANAVTAGMISTSFHDTFTKMEVREKVAAGTPLRREGQAEEVADLVAYLASDQSSFITGAGIDINGGMLFS